MFYESFTFQLSLNLQLNDFLSPHYFLCGNNSLEYFNVNSTMRDFLSIAKCLVSEATSKLKAFPFQQQCEIEIGNTSLLVSDDDEINHQIIIISDDAE